jgi:hypothetical protein
VNSWDAFRNASGDFRFASGVSTSSTRHFPNSSDVSTNSWMGRQDFVGCLEQLAEALEFRLGCLHERLLAQSKFVGCLSKRLHALDVFVEALDEFIGRRNEFFGP